RPVLVAVEEEQLVVAPGTADRTANRVAPRAVLADRLGHAVLLVLPAVAVPVRVAFDVVERTMELVRAALGDGRDLQARRAAELGVVTRRADLDLGNRRAVHVQHLAVGTPIHGREAVHHDVVLARATETRAAGRRAARHD